MLRAKPCREIDDFGKERRIIPQDEEILICLNCPLPKCISTYNCERFKEERLRIRRELHGKKDSKRNKKSSV